jgi:hypothetical protein
MIPGRSIALASILLAGMPLARGQTKAPEWAQRLVRDVRTSSFPELAKEDIRVRQFASESDYFQARFSIWRFILGRRMRYVIRVNSGATLLTAPEEGRRAIVAHELAHLAYYGHGNRVHLLSLLRYPSRGFRERFEKGADIEAVRRGYAQGLRQYRIWLYGRVPLGALAKKRRDYLSPDEIDTLQRQIGK